MNIKKRLKNKTFVLTMLLAAIAFAYQMLGIMEITPAISKDDIVNAAGIGINILVALGILVDPTTSGITDGELPVEAGETDE